MTSTHGGRSRKETRGPREQESFLAGAEGSSQDRPPSGSCQKSLMRPNKDDYIFVLIELLRDLIQLPRP